ncbi:integrase [Roseovarius mucosus]|uniref:Integrase n=1 Tax=Roseovarius mucosus TaxID=215743 RepID=A0A1V0RRZ7_9RHOB|nr:integrase [Roseovarius mucosus]
MRDHDISQRRACRLVGVDPKTVRRERLPDNPEIRKEMKAVAAKRRRFGYRRIGVMLERKGMIMKFGGLAFDLADHNIEMRFQVFRPT